MANDRQSLVNYEAILYLWNASEVQRVQFLASLSPEQRTQFCDVLRDVLNNPWEGRSAIKLTKLNKLLGQNAGLLKKQVQFSGDRTPELDEKQLYRLLHDYLILNHDGTRRLTELGRQNLEQLLITVNAEFETFYDRDESHPLLMWNGFQNDTEFPGAGMAKTQVEPTDYSELNAKITNYYYPVGAGKPAPTDDNDGQNGGDDGNDDEFHDWHSGGHSAALPLNAMHRLYLPFLLGYTATAAYVGFFRNNGIVGLLLWLGTAFAAVKWYHVVKFAMRGWAALLQGAWIVYIMLAMASETIMPLTIANLVWPVGAFLLLTRCLHCATPGQRKFSTIWTSVLAAICAAAIVGVVINRPEPRTVDDDYYFVPADDVSHGGNGGHVPSGKQAKPSPEETLAHIESLRAEPGGLRWDTLQPSDLEYLEPEELDNLRVQLTVLIRNCYGRTTGVSVTSMEELSSSKDSRFTWKAAITLDREVLDVRKDDFGLSDVLGTGQFLVVCDSSGSGAKLDISFSVPYRDEIKFFIAECGKTVRNDLTAHFGDSIRHYGDAIRQGSPAAEGLLRLRAVVEKIHRQIKSDELIAQADEAASKRIRSNRSLLDGFRNAVRDMCREAKRRPDGASTVIETLPESLELMIWRQEHPGELTEAEKRLKNEWPSAKSRHLAEINRMRTVKNEKTSSPYRYNSSSAEKLEAALKDFETIVGKDDFLSASEKAETASAALSGFESGCRWQSGISRGDGYRSSATPGRWELEPGWEIVNGRPVNVAAETEKRLRGEWPSTKHMFLETIERIKAFRKERTAVPWKFDYGSSSRLESALRDFESVVARDDFKTAPEKLEKLRDALDEFKGSCRWQSGVSRGDGYRSGTTTGQWELEPGYEMVNGRPMKVSVCRTCNGTGSVTKRERCAECSGSGKVQNPAAMAKDIGGLFGVKVPVNVPKYISCSACSGAGSIPRTYRCNICSGRGKIHQ